MNLSTRQLEGFLQVARLNSFTRAAERLHLTQAGLSAAIRELESQYGCKLFDRTTRSVSLTAEGRALVPFAERIANELRASATAVQTTAAAARSILTIAVTPIAATTLIADACHAFSSRMPEVEVRIRDVPQPEIQRLVEASEVDFGLTIFLKPAAQIEAIPLTTFRLVCIAPRGVLATRDGKLGAEMRWRDLPDRTLITLPATTQMQQFLDQHLMDNCAFAGPRTAYNSMQTMLAMVAGGQGMTILPSMVLPACDLDRVDMAFLTHPSTPIRYFRISKRGRQLSQAAHMFVETLTSTSMARQDDFRQRPG